MTTMQPRQLRLERSKTCAVIGGDLESKGPVIPALFSRLFNQITPRCPLPPAGRHEHHRRPDATHGVTDATAYPRGLCGQSTQS